MKINIHKFMPLILFVAGTILMLTKGNGTGFYDGSNFWDYSGIVLCFLGVGYMAILWVYYLLKK